MITNKELDMLCEIHKHWETLYEKAIYDAATELRQRREAEINGPFRSRCEECSSRKKE